MGLNSFPKGPPNTEVDKSLGSYCNFIRIFHMNISLLQDIDQTIPITKNYCYHGAPLK